MSGLWAKLEDQLIDTHCHVLDYKEPDFIQKLNDSKITTHAVTTTLAEFKRLFPLLENCKHIFPSMGLFPLKAKEEGHNLEEFLDLIPQTKLIGEIGLDYTVPEEERVLQRQILEKIISKCNESGDKTLSLHSRDSAEDVFKIIGADFQGSAIMHWYSGPAELIDSAPKNIYFSVNTAMLKSRKGKEILQSLKPQQVLTETDGPYVKINAQASQPQDIRIVVQSLSQKWQKTIEETLKTIQENYARATNFSGA
ncbi:MAG: TatD family hydrolase [Lentisphaerales bacterium]|nr:TatD family hydrolase [Lentisphaerales bacterium]